MAAAPQVVTHPVFGVGTVRAVEIGWDAPGQVRQTINLMRQRVKEDAQDPEFRAHVQRVLGLGDGGGDGAFTPREIARAAWDHVHNHMRFVQDRELAAGLKGVIPDQWADEAVEWSMRPKDTARYVEMGVAAGDCDCFEEYLAGLLAVGGVDCAFVTVAANPEQPDVESHVYVRAYLPGGEVMALDASHGEWAGWEVPNRFNCLTEWPVGAVGVGGQSKPGWVEILAMAAGVAGVALLVNQFGKTKAN